MLVNLTIETIAKIVNTRRNTVKKYLWIQDPLGASPRQNNPRGDHSPTRTQQGKALIWFQDDYLW